MRGQGKRIKSEILMNTGLFGRSATEPATPRGAFHLLMRLPWHATVGDYLLGQISIQRYRFGGH